MSCPGLGAKDSGTMNCIRKHQDDSKYTKIIDCGYTNLSDEEIEKHMATWVKEHPKYAVTQDNCQLFVRDILYALTGKPITTQNNHLGNAAIGVGVVAAVTAVCTIAAGIFVRNH